MVILHALAEQIGQIVAGELKLLAVFGGRALPGFVEVQPGGKAAGALAIRPEVLLMDEPASALDPIATQHIEELIYELKRDYTIVIVTHNMQQAARVSDLTAFYWLGRLVESGPTAEVFTNPRQRLTEDYVTGRFG